MPWIWTRFNAIDYIVTAAAGAGYIYVEFFVPPKESSSWTTPILFDSAFRDFSLAKSRIARERSGTWSDITASLPLAMAFADGLLPLLTDRGNFDTTWQLSMINLQAAAVTSLVTRGTHRLLGRERPDSGPCLEDPEYSNQCFRGVNSSFFSGHTSTAFAGAGLVCLHHLKLPLYGGPIQDAAACAFASSVAVVTGALRLNADRHYVSDVLVGAAVGAGAGFFMPWLLHYHKPKAKTEASAAEVQISLAPVPHPDALGLSLFGLF